ncbi:MAG: transposase [Desulfomonilaceae bacterium]
MGLFQPLLEVADIFRTYGEHYGATYRWYIVNGLLEALNQSLIKYLGLYTHKGAIPNHRRVEINNGVVTFFAGDNHNTVKTRYVYLPADKFIKRFLIHILPSGFVKILHYGLMAHKNAKTSLKIPEHLSKKIS